MNLDPLHAAVAELQRDHTAVQMRVAEAERLYAVTLQRLNDTRAALQGLVAASRAKDADWAKVMEFAERMLELK